MRIRNVLAGAGLCVAMLLSGPVAASAAWDTGSAGTSLSVRAAVLPVSLAPAVEAHGSSLFVRWPAVVGYPVRGYRLLRLDTVTQVATAVGDDCQGLLHRTHCVEHDVPAGRWDYRVVAVVGDNWTTRPSAAVSVPVGDNKGGAPGKTEPVPGPTRSRSGETPTASPRPSEPEPSSEPGPEATATPEASAEPAPEPTPTPSEAPVAAETE